MRGRADGVAGAREAADPLAEIRTAREAARQAGDPCADVCYFLTVGPEGRPEGRALTLRDITAGGFGVQVSRVSPKWAQMSGGRCGLLIHWPAIARQYRINGPIVEMEAGEVLALWRLKSHESRLLSNYYVARQPQSHPVPSREDFLRGIEELRTRWPDRDAVPMPETVAGIRVVPETIETWHGAGDSRLHDRRLYTRAGSGWTFSTLVP